MQSRRQQRTVQHYVANLARQCNDQSKEVKEVKQQIDSVVESIEDCKINMDTRLDTVENTVEIMSKNVEELAIRIPKIVEKCIDKKGIYIFYQHTLLLFLCFQQAAFQNMFTIDLLEVPFISFLS